MKKNFKAMEIAAYIQNYYLNKTGKEISPLRLQKTLYFVFAYWGGFVEKSKMQKDKEIDLDDYNVYLFDERIEAWVYGPVVPNVYFEPDISRFYKEDLFQGMELVQEVVDDVIDDTIKVSDFRLVDISHSDDAWINNFSYEEEFHNNEIDKSEIIKEYARK